MRASDRRTATWWRGAFAATLLLAMAAGTLAQFALGVLAPFLRADLDLSRAQLGSLTTIFFVVGMLGSPFAGRLVDRIGGRTTLLAMFWIAAGSLVATAAAGGYATIAAAMAVAGLATALVNPVTNQLIAVEVPRGQQGMITGVKQSGVQAGAFLAGALLPTAALAFGWRGALLVAAGVVFVGVVATHLVVPRPASPDGGDGHADERPPPAGFVRWLAGYAFLMGAGVAAVGAFLVLYAVEALDLSEARAGLAAATVGGVGVVARILWGRAAERMATPTAPLLVLAVTSVLAQGLIWGASAAGEWLLWVGAVAFGITAAAWNAVGMLAIVREVEPAATGRASGVVQASFYGGLVVCPVLFGASVDATGGYDVGWAGVTGAFVAATVLATAWHVRHRPSSG